MSDDEIADYAFSYGGKGGQQEEKPFAFGASIRLVS